MIVRKEVTRCLSIALVLFFCPWVSLLHSQSDTGVDLLPKKTWFGRYGYVNRLGKYVLEPQYEEALPFSDFLAAVKKDGKWGFINGEGKFVIEPRFENAFLFSDGAAAVEENEKWGFINRSGKYLVQPKYESAGIFRQGLAAVRWEGKWGFISKDGEMVVPQNSIRFTFSRKTVQEPKSTACGGTSIGQVHSLYPQNMRRPSPSLKVSQLSMWEVIGRTMNSLAESGIS